MSMAHSFFKPLGAHFSAAMADLGDDLLAAHRVFTAMITAMSTFEDEVLNAAPSPQQNSDQRAAQQEAAQ